MTSATIWKPVVNGMRRLRLGFVPGVLLPILAACGTDVSGEPAQETSSAAVVIHTAGVAYGAVVEPVRAAGSVAPQDEAELSFKIGGVVAAVAIEEGARVRRGQTLATLDLREIDAHVARARSVLANAERDLARAQALYADSVATLEQLQDAATAAEVAAADFQAASFNRRYATITAPMDGVILRRHAEPGELLAPGQPVVLIGGTSSGWVLRVALADRDVVRTRVGDPAEIVFDALPGRIFAGRVSQVAAAPDARSGTYDVEVAIERASQELTAGLIGQVEIRPTDAQRLHVIPIEALVEADGDRGVVYGLTLDGTRARRVEITIGFLDGDRVAVRDGLDGVADVVTDGAAYLTDGTPVRRLP